MKKQTNNKKIKSLTLAKKVKDVKAAKTAKSVKASKKSKSVKTIKAVKTFKVAKKIQTSKRVRRAKKALLSFGNLGKGRGRILILLVLIIFMLTYMALSRFVSVDKESGMETPVQTIQKKEKTPLQNEISEMVKGYPIEKMMPYILEQNPKTAMFLVAIAKKESAWGKRKPVLDGQDCFNYWGFRLKAEKMGSGGHTCFNSPKEAVETVSERIDQLVNEEDIDTPSDMIVWKCGYGCQDQPKSLSEKKWINDVDFYYSAMNEYL